MLSISFSGPRPDKLGGFHWNSPFNRTIRKSIKEKLLELIMASDDKEVKIICGGALGVDQYAFETAIELREDNRTCKTIILELAIPFDKQYCKWHPEDIERHFRHIKEADIVTYVDTIRPVKSVPIGIYNKDKMDNRNEYMVDGSDYFISYWDGTPGGSKNCYDYAKKTDVQIIRINPKDLRPTMNTNKFNGRINFWD